MNPSKTSITRKAAAISLILLTYRTGFPSAAAPVPDASYQETTQITGGTMVDALKQGGAFMGNRIKALFAPDNTITMVHGNQKAVIRKDSIEVWDLDAGTITRANVEKKTYYVTTFADMRKGFTEGQKQLADLQAKNAENLKQVQASQPPPNLQMTFDVKVNNTGVSKMVNGLMAQEQIITMSARMALPPDAANGTAAAPAAGAPGAAQPAIAYTVTTDAWIAPDPPELQEIRDFDLRMAKKMMEGVDMSAFLKQMQAGQQTSNAAMASVLGNQPGAAEALRKMGEEMNKIKGIRVLEVTSVGGTATGVPTATAGASGPATPPPTAGNVAGQVATDTATQTAAGESSKMGVFGSAISSSALNAFRRKKATPPAATPAPATAPTPSTGTTTVSNVMMQTTSQKTNFSRETIPSTAFQIPAGFKRVPSPMEQASR